MVQGALTYPTDRDDWVKTVLIGGVLMLVGFLLIPLFVVYGYIVRAIRTSIDGETEPPVFEEWERLLVDGLKAWVIGLVYMIIPVVVGVLTIGTSMAALVTGGRVGATAGLAGMLGGLVLTGVLALLFGYVAVAGLVNFAHERRFGAAFEFGTLRNVIFSSDFLIAWAVSIAVFFVAGILASVPAVGFILGPIATFYAAVVAARLWAGGFVDAVEMTETSADVEEGQAAV